MRLLKMDCDPEWNVDKQSFNTCDTTSAILSQLIKLFIMGVDE
jgi:hypothetical protein